MDSSNISDEYLNVLLMNSSRLVLLFLSEDSVDIWDMELSSDCSYISVFDSFFFLLRFVCLAEIGLFRILLFIIIIFLFF